MSSLDNKLIIYDSNCKVCSFLRDMILAVTSIPETMIAAYNDLSPEFKSKIDASRFRNEMALIDKDGQETIYGAEGVSYIFSSQSGFLRILFANKLVFRIFYFLYRVLAFNRYLIATPRNYIACDCYPEKRLNFRIAYIIIITTFNLLMSIYIGISIRSLGMQPLAVPLMVWSGTILQFIFALSILKTDFPDYLGHLCTILLVGLALMLPSALTLNFFDVSEWVLIGNVSFSILIMLRLHVHRVKFLGLSQICSVTWLALLLSGIFIFKSITL